MTVFLPLLASAQDTDPGISPSVTYISDEGKETEGWENFAGQAPLDVTFRANPRNMESYTPVKAGRTAASMTTRRMMIMTSIAAGYVMAAFSFSRIVF